MMITVHGRMVAVVATVAAMMMSTIEMMVETRGVVALTALLHLSSTPHVKSATSTSILQRTAGGAMEMMMIPIVAARVTRVQTLHPMV
jgi:hypothetical protein